MPDSARERKSGISKPLFHFRSRHAERYAPETNGAPANSLRWDAATGSPAETATQTRKNHLGILVYSREFVAKVR